MKTPSSRWLLPWCQRLRVMIKMLISWSISKFLQQNFHSLVTKNLLRMMFFERYAKSSYIYKQQMYEMGNVFLRGNKRIFLCLWSLDRSENQYGAIPKSSTMHVLISMLDSWTNNTLTEPVLPLEWYFLIIAKLLI